MLCAAIQRQNRAMWSCGRAGLLAAALMASLGGCSQRTAAADAGSPSPPAAVPTAAPRVEVDAGAPEGPSFHVEVPAGWKQLPGSTPTRALYQSPDAHEQLTVSVLRMAVPASGDEQLEILKKVVRDHQEAARKMYDADALTFSDTNFGETRGQAWARYAGLVPPNHHIWTVIRFGPGTIAVFFVEATGAPEQAASEHAKAILDSATVLSAEPDVGTPR